MAPLPLRLAVPRKARRWRCIASCGLVLLLFPLFFVPRNLLMKDLLFGRIAIADNVSLAAGSGVMLALGFCGYGPWAILLGDLTNRVALYETLRLLHPVSPHTLVHEVTRARPGTALRVQPDGRLVEESTFDWAYDPAAEGARARDLDAQAAEIKAVVAEAIRGVLAHPACRHRPRELSLTGGLDLARCWRLHRLGGYEGWTLFSLLSAEAAYRCLVRREPQDAVVEEWFAR